MLKTLSCRPTDPEDYLFLHRDWTALMSEDPTCHNIKLNKRSSLAEQSSWPRPLERVLSHSGMILYIISHHVLNFCPGRLWLHILATRSTNASLSRENSRSLCWVMACNVADEMIHVSRFSLQPDFKEERERERGMEVKRAAVDRRPSQLWCVQ